MRILVALVLAALALPAAAAAHGDAIIRAAADGLRDDTVYVHEDAIPTLTADEADELRSRIDEAGGEIRVAVLPADALHEAKDAETVLERVLARVNKKGTYVAVVGGQFQATSTADDIGPAEGQRLARDAFRERLALAPTLYALVELIREERGQRGGAGVDDEDDDRRSWLWIGGGLAALLGIVLLAPSIVGTLRRARRRSSVG